MQPLFAEVWSTGASQSQTPGENMADSKTGERMTTVVQKEARFRPQVQIPSLTERSQHRGGLRPKRAVALLSPFSKQSHLKRLGQLEITPAQFRDLLDASAGVEHRCQQCIVAASLHSGPVDGLENRVDLLILQVVDRSLSGAL